MSEARERLIEDGMRHIEQFGTEIALRIPGKRTLSRTMLARFLSRPDDLLAVLVEAGVLEQADPGEMRYRRTRAGWLEWRRDAKESEPRGHPVTFYRRTEEAK